MQSDSSPPFQRFRKKVLRADRRYLKGRLSLLRHVSSPSEYRRILNVSKSPVLIGGCGRSGTTLLLSLMSVHSNIYAFPEETEYFCPGIWQVGIEKCRERPFSIDLIYQHLSENDVNLQQVSRWCEKTPMNVHFIGEILDFFGRGCRFLNIVRDGRDVVTSHHPSDPNNHWVSPDRWIRDVAAGRRWEDHHQVLSIRYEDLVSDHLSEMERICNFIGEPFTERFEDYPESSAFEDNRAWSGKASAIHQDSVKRWEKDVHQPVVDRLLDSEKAKDLLGHYKYL